MWIEKEEKDLRQLALLAVTFLYLSSFKILDKIAKKYIIFLQQTKSYNNKILL
jgi:hypothetical protein